jgi:signal transduction histidine kinase
VDVDRLERMTGETLDFVRGAEKLVLRSVPLGLLVAELAAGIEAELPGLRVERHIDLPGGRRGPVDVDKIRRAVSNIAANARDAMGGSGRLVLTARPGRAATGRASCCCSSSPTTDPASRPASASASSILS